MIGDRIDKSLSIPAHEQVRERIRSLIRRGELKVGDKLPPEPEIAKTLGVSRMTANKAILALTQEGWLTREKGRGTFVANPELDRCIRECLICLAEDPARAELDYYFGGLYWPLCSLLDEHGIQGRLVRLDKLPDASTGPRGRGFIAINPPETALDELIGLRHAGAPVVLLGSSWPAYGFHEVDSDNVLGAALAVNHLIDRGHGRIMFVGACPGDANTRDRVRGYQLAGASRGLAFDPRDLLIAPDATGLDEISVSRISERLTASDAPTAVFAAGARSAMQVIALAQAQGLEVPRSLSVVGYDDPEFLSLAFPAVTTVRQPLAEMAAHAVELLLLAAGSGDPRPHQAVLNPELVVRNSTTFLSPSIAGESS